MRTHNLGYPRIGSQRELKKACENYWAGKISLTELLHAGKQVRQENWKLQQDAGIDLIPIHDFSYYDQALDTSLMLGNIPSRFLPLVQQEKKSFPTLYFAMARGYQKGDMDVTALEMTKWFDTNYHYLVPEFYKNQTFSFVSTDVISEFLEAKALGINAKPVMLGPVSYLLLGKEKETGFHRLDLLKSVLPIYKEVLDNLNRAGAVYIQLDEPCLTLDLDESAKQTFREAYHYFAQECPGIKILLATYFGELGENLPLTCLLPVDTLHVDLVRAPEQLDDVLKQIPDNMSLSLGIVDGRNIWKNNYDDSLIIINKATQALGTDRIWIAPSCSLLHSPCDLDMEMNEKVLSGEVKRWMSFAKQKLSEVVDLSKIATLQPDKETENRLAENRKAHQSRLSSALIHDLSVQARVAAVQDKDMERGMPFDERKKLQSTILNLPLLPTTTIGSFPQTKEVREARAKFKKGIISKKDYADAIRTFTQETVKIQEEIGLDVLVHGEFERNDMVEYFGEQLNGFAFTQNGWVQSYGSRCVKPPVIYGDVSRPAPMTVDWINYAKSLTEKPVKGMLTGPVTILQWSFVRNDQPRSATAMQIALAIRDEVSDLEQAGVKIIQVDEPAIREGLPLRKVDWANYLEWAVKAFRLSVSSAQPQTQVHTHMCYSEFNDIITSIAAMDADVITIETSRSQMKLLDVFINFKYPNDIGPGVYDIHSPRVPLVAEIEDLLCKAMMLIPVGQLWVNPDCGLKTRNWDETVQSLKNMVQAAKNIRSNE
ncbi:MAG: 5-methyltetrahydropteroyltriglutamate--homocysteine S-methyltransferase [Dysgonamonadaceae bacterium]|jgi:5-methyltetrahydropteroyltriglutamate--homocysteine methyltransferase|nr:5-methyltetrahydropteroyltriglutamate--homocysteine S-methyltransferase [Dysgonamonadaceae bacterium]